MTVAAKLSFRAPRTRRAVLSASVAATTLGWCLAAHALPQGGVVTAGSASIGSTATTTTITQSSDRTFIDWNTFNISKGETVTFAQPSTASIAFNRVNPANFTTVLGSMNANGGVWLFSPAGLLIGPTAQINVGSFLASTGFLGSGPSGPSGGVGAITASNTIDLSGAKAAITVDTGAVVNASHGFVILHGEQITQKGSVTASDGVAYVLGNDANVSFDPGPSAPGQSIVSINTGLSTAGKPGLDHSGSTSGAWVGVYTPPTEEAGFTGVINLGGVMQATAIATSQQRQGSAVLLGSPGKAYDYFGNTILNVDESKGSLTATNGGLTVSGADVTLGAVDVKGSITANADNNLLIAGTVKAGDDVGLSAFQVTVQKSLTATNGVTSSSLEFDLADNATVSSAGFVSVSVGDTITLGAGSVINGDSGGAGKGGYVNLSGPVVDGDATSLVFAGAKSSAPTGDVYMQGYEDLTTGQVSGTNVSLFTQGDLTINGAVLATNSLSIDPYDLTINADVTTSGDLQLFAGNNLTLGENVTVKATGSIDAEAIDTITLADGATLQSDYKGVGGTDFYVEARSIDAAPTSLLLNGPDATHGKGPVTVYADGGDLKVGKVTGTTVLLRARGSNFQPSGPSGPAPSGPITGGSLFIQGKVLGSDGLTGISDYADINVEGDIQAGGIGLYADNDINVGAVKIVSSGAAFNAVNIDAGGNYTADKASLIQVGPAQPTSNDDVSIFAGGDITSGAITADDVELTTNGDITINGDILGTDGVFLDPFNITINANVTSGGILQLFAQNDLTIAPNVTVKAAGFVDAEALDTITIGAGATLQADSSGEGASNLYVEAASVDAAPTSLLLAGPSANNPTSDVTVYSDGGDLTVGKVSGVNVLLEARDSSYYPSGPSGGSPSFPATGGSLFINGAVLGKNSVQGYSDFGDIEVSGSVTSGGYVDLEADGDIRLNAKAVVNAESDGAGDDTVYINAGGDFTAAADSLVLAGPTADAPTSNVTIDAGGDITTGRVSGANVSLYTPNNVTINGALLGTQSVTIDPWDININANVTSGGDLDLFADHNLTVGDNVIVSAAGRLDAEASDTITVGDGSVLQADSGGEGGTELYVEAATVNAAPTSLLLAGPDAENPTSNVTVYADGGDLTVGSVAGRTVVLEARGGDVHPSGPSGPGPSGPLTGGSLFINGSVFGTQNVSGASDFVDVEVNGDVVSSGGSVTLQAAQTLTFDEGSSASATGNLFATGSEIVIGPEALLRSSSDDSGGAVFLNANGDVTADATSLVVAGSDAGDPSGDVNETTFGGDITTGRISGVSVSLFSFGDITINGDVLATGDLTLNPPTNIYINANVTTQSDLILYANNDIAIGDDVVVKANGNVDAEALNAISVGDGSTLQSGYGGDGEGNLYVEAKTVDAAPTSLLLAGPTPNNPNGTVTVFADGGDLKVGKVAGTTVLLHARGSDFKPSGPSGPSGGSPSGPVSGGSLFINGAVLGTSSVTGLSDYKNVEVNADVTSGGDIDLEAAKALDFAAGVNVAADNDLFGGATTITLGANAVVRSDADGKGGGDVELSADDSYTADKTSLVAGGASGAPNDDVYIFAGDNLVSGKVSASNVDIESSGGDVTIVGAVFGDKSVFVDPGNLTVKADVTGNGTITLIADGAGALTIDPNVQVHSTGGQVYLESGGDMTVGGAVTGVSLYAITQKTLHLSSGGSFTTTGTSSAPNWPILPASVSQTPQGGAPVTATGMNILANGLDLQGSLTAGPSGNRDDIYIQSLGSPATVFVGGSGSGTEFRVSNAAFSHITARNVIVMAGRGEGAGGNADVKVEDLTLDPGKISGLGIGTSSDKTVTVTGAVTLTGPGAVDLHVGFARNPGGSGPSGSGPSGSAPLQGFIPGEIDITGSLGSASQPFHAVTLLARNNIFMGSDTFITAAKADPAFDAVKSSKSNAPSADHVFVAADNLGMGANGRIIQQNTSDTGFGGLILKAPTPEQPLIVAPASLTGVALGGWTADFTKGPTQIDVFGRVTKADNTVVSDVTAALLPNLLASSITTKSAYRINSCIFGTDCQVTVVEEPPPRFEEPPDPSIPLFTIFPSLLIGQDITIPEDEEDDRRKNGAPVTQSGNGDLWTGPTK